MLIRSVAARRTRRPRRGAALTQGHGIAYQNSEECVEKGDKQMTQPPIAELWEWAEYY
ncbi:MAG TPA: hypothetical protein VFE42_11875 [Chloroflexota bacterium]|nr:hypothetical protein [Chloroflexota bacterium]